MTRMIALWAVAALFSGCAMLDSRSPEEIVAERALTRLTLLMQGDYEGAYNLTAPGYRTLESVGQFKRRWKGAAFWTGVEVSTVNCDDSASRVADQCAAVIAITFDAPRMPEVTTHITESWLKIDGRWYYYQPRGGAL